MKYKLVMASRFFTGFIFCIFFFIGSMKSFVWESYVAYYLISLISSILYLYCSYLVSYYNMHYFFEFKKEFIMKLTLIISMYGCAFLFKYALPAIVEIEIKPLLFVYFIGFYLAFDILSELAIIATSYSKTVDVETYTYKMISIVDYYEKQSENKNRQNEYSKKAFRTIPIISKFILSPAYDCFMDYEEVCYAFFDKSFYSKLLEFSKKNQIFYGVKIKDDNHILDKRCNIVDITKENFSFIDGCGRKCIFTHKIEKQI